MNQREIRAKRVERIAEMAKQEKTAIDRPHDRIADIRRKRREKLDEMRKHPENLVKVDGEVHRKRMQEMREKMRKRA